MDCHLVLDSKELRFTLLKISFKIFPLKYSHMHRWFSLQGLGTAYSRVKIIKVQLVVFVKKVSHQVNNYTVSQTMILTLIQFSCTDLKFQTVPRVSLA